VANVHSFCHYILVERTWAFVGVAVLVRHVRARTLSAVKEGSCTVAHAPFGPSSTWYITRTPFSPRGPNTVDL